MHEKLTQIQEQILRIINDLGDVRSSEIAIELMKINDDYYSNQRVSTNCASLHRKFLLHICSPDYTKKIF